MTTEAPIEATDQIERGSSNASEVPEAPAHSSVTTKQESTPQKPTHTPPKGPQNVLQAVYAAGQNKANMPISKLLVQSLMAGIYKGVACQVYLTVGGGMLGAALFPTVLIAIVLTSAELFTGDIFVLVASFLGGKVHYVSLVRNFSVSWVLNFCGCLVWGGLMTYASNALEDAGQVDFAVSFAEQKALQPWWQIFVRGIGANFLVCLAIWQATTAQNVEGKILAIWFPIASFVVMGLDHVVANMHFITVGMMYGADVSVVHLLFSALLPATLGNMIGGGLGIGVTYWYVFDEMASEQVLGAKIREGFESIKQVENHVNEALKEASKQKEGDQDKSPQITDQNPSVQIPA